MSKFCGGVCGGDVMFVVDIDIQVFFEVLGRWVSVYVVLKMDCLLEE